MARPFERMRLKDKIVDDVSKAIKAIQEKLYYMSKDPASSPNKENLILSNGDRLCHRLCDKLDHALLHGLKDVTHGYWKLVKQLSHRGVAKEIDILTNVTTDLGRGRAWLYVALNEGLLESYIKLLTENDKIMKKHYNKEALMLDKDKMSMLLTITCGLEFVTFQLEYDLPYLDLSPSPPRTETGFQDEEYTQEFRKPSFTEAGTYQCSDSDSASIVSDVSSTHDRKISFDQVTGEAITSTGNNGDTKGFTALSPKNSSLSLRSDRASTPNDSSNTSGYYRGRLPSDAQSMSSVSSHSDLDRHQRFENIVSVNRDLPEETEDSLEVIRVKSKKKKRKLKSISTTSTLVGTNTKSHSEMVNMSAKPEADSNSDIKNSELESESQTSMSSCGKSEIEVHDRISFNSPAEQCENSSREAIPQLDSDIDISGIISEMGDLKEKSEVNPRDLVGFVAIKADDQQQSPSNKAKTPIENSSSLSVIERKIAEMCKDTGMDDMVNHQNQTNGKSAANNVLVSDSTDSVKHNVPDSVYRDHRFDDSSDGASNGGVRRGDSPAFGDKDLSPTNPGRSGSPLTICNTKAENEEAEDYYDVYSTKSPSRDESGKSRNGKQPTRTKLQEASYLQDYMDCVLQESEGTGQLSPKQDSGPQDFSLSLDNNTKLQVMLEIFKQEDEAFVKMFACRENHTEGHFSVAFVLISDQYLYLLHYGTKSRKFAVQSVTKLTDIIFISTGLFEQTLNIESRDKSRQKQRLWLTPGHQDLTKAIVQSLTEVVKEANANIVSVRSRFSVGSDIPLQKIGLRKYISKELHCETQDVVISDYSLVFWEDPSSSKSGFSDSSRKDGTLLLRMQDPVKGYIWKPVYVLLRGSMLSVSNSKSDPRPHSYLGLGGDQCIGCRLTEVGERHHCVELVLAQGGSWFLSAASEEEILDWRRALCLAVSQGVEEMGALSSCVPCCCIQASGQLFMCHEDLDTKFFRTLGRAQLEDVTGLSSDQEGTTYCIVEFESQEVGVSSGKWVFHFASSADMRRFTSSLAACWMEIFQVDLPITPLDDVTLQRHCQTHSLLLHKAFQLR